MLRVKQMNETLNLETGMELSLEKGSKVSKAVLRGWKNSHYLLVEMPDISWSRPDSSEIIGRLFGKGRYYGFTTTQLGVLMEFKLVVLRYPDDIMATSYRQNERYNATLPVTISRSAETGQADDVGVITDISEGGCKLVCQKTYHVGSKIFLQIDFPTGSRIDKLACILRAETNLGDKNSYGVEFDVIDDDELNPLREFLKQVQAYQIR